MKNGKANGYGGEEHSEHEMHIWTERERRKKMKNMFSNLHALLPQLPSKADKSTIVDEAVKYIKNLQQTLQTLQKRKLEKLRNATMGDYEQSSIITSQVQAPESMEAFLSDQLGPSILNHSLMNTDMSNTFPNPISLACFQTWFPPSVIISMSGDDAHMCLFAEEARDISHHLVHSTKTPAGGGVCSHFL